MKTLARYLYGLLALGVLALVGCTVDTKDSEDTMSILPQPPTEEEPWPERVIIEQVGIDMDNDGIIDTFKLTAALDTDTLIALVNSKHIELGTVSTFYTTIENPKVHSENEINSTYFHFFKTEDGGMVLLLKEMGDYAGPTFDFYSVIDNEFGLLFTIQREIIEIIDYGTQPNLSMVFKAITTEPGSMQGYTFVNYPLYEVYVVKENEVIYDSLRSVEYNLKHDSNFVEYQKMKQPVWGSHNSDTIPARLIDLDELGVE